MKFQIDIRIGDWVKVLCTDTGNYIEGYILKELPYGWQIRNDKDTTSFGENDIIVVYKSRGEK